MLIVVAIIAILIAISIPLINSALEKAKHATDAANERAAKAIILVAALDGGEVIEKTAANGSTAATFCSFNAGDVYAYNAKDGKLTKYVTNTAEYKYGKHHTNGYVVITMDSAGTVTMGWSNSTTAPTKIESANTCGEQTDSSHEASFATTN